MNMPIIILNIAVFFFAFLLVFSLNNRFRFMFLTGALLPIILCYGVAFIFFDAINWSAQEYFVLLMRGLFILAIFIGALLCYLVSNKKDKK